MIELHLEMTTCVMEAANKRDKDNLSAVCPLPPLGLELPAAVLGESWSPDGRSPAAERCPVAPQRQSVPSCPQPSVWEEVEVFYSVLPFP